MFNFAINRYNNIINPSILLNLIRNGFEYVGVFYEMI